MATVCSNTSSSSSSSISNSSEQKLNETNENDQNREENFINQLNYETQLKETIQNHCDNPYTPSNTAHSNNLNEFNYFSDDLLDSANKTNNNSGKNSLHHDQAASPSAIATSNVDNTNEYQALRIKVKSIENHLLPLVNQITSLVNFRDLTSRKLAPTSSPRFSQTSNSPSFNSEKNASALMRVGEAVSIAVERFVNVGEKIAYENPSIKLEMLEACRHAKNAGLAIKIHTQIPNSVLNEIGIISSNNDYGIFSSSTDKFSMIQAANNLLNSVTKVLLLADIVIINQILKSKNKVSLSLMKLENATDMNTFLDFFKQYGDDLVELARLSGDRQNDLKDDKRRSQLSSSRWILEKSTIMLLYSSKTFLQHMDCECSRENVGLVYTFVHQALENLHQIVIDSGSIFNEKSYNNKLLLKSSIVQISFLNAYRQFEDTLELAKNNMISESSGDAVFNALNDLIESTQDFTDSLYINNDQRDRIIRLQNEIREQTLNYLKEDQPSSNESRDPNNNIENFSSNATNSSVADSEFKFNRFFNSSNILNNCDVLKKLLQTQTMQIANTLFKENQDATLLNCLKKYSLLNHYDLLIETLDKFKEYSDHVLELCKMLRHISSLDIFEATCEHHFNVFENLSKMIQSSAGTTALFPTCVSSSETLNFYCDCWENQINDLSVLVKEMQEFMSGIKSNKSVYLSLPRPGKHGVVSNRLTPTGTLSSKLDLNEQAKIAKLGLEMRLIQNEIEAEADKWNEPQNEIVKLAKSMSEMACEIHLFTRGEGPLKTTRDLFARVEIFLQHGVLFYGIIKEFIMQVPQGYLRDELVQLLEKVPQNYKQLKNRVRQNTFGKTQTFNKVDWVIQDVRDFTNLVVKLVTNCFLCCSKYNINYEETRGDASTILSLENIAQSLRFQNIALDTESPTNHLNELLYDDQIMNTNTPARAPSYNTLNKSYSSAYTPTRLQTSNIRSNFLPSQRHSVNFMLGSGVGVGSSTRSDSCGPDFRANLLHRN